MIKLHADAREEALLHNLVELGGADPLLLHFLLYRDERASRLLLRIRLVRVQGREDARRERDGRRNLAELLEVQLRGDHLELRTLVGVVLALLRIRLRL